MADTGEGGVRTAAPKSDPKGGRGTGWQKSGRMVGAGMGALVFVAAGIWFLPQLDSGLQHRPRARSSSADRRSIRASGLSTTATARTLGCKTSSTAMFGRNSSARR